MVLIHIKKTDLNQFIYEASRGTPIAQLIQDIVEINNLRVKVDRAAHFIEELVKAGPLKPEETRGLAEGENSTEPDLPGHRFCVDETHYRTGWCVPEDLGIRIFETTQAAKRLIHKTNAERRIPLTRNQLLEALDLMKGAVMMAYPAYHGLPPWEPAMLVLESPDIKELAQGEDIFEAENSSLWFAGKEMMRGKDLGFYVKGSENTKIIAKIQKQGQGAPAREPVVDADTQKNMIAFYHKKQEEAKKLMSVDEDEYLNSAWADPKNLKRQLNGTGDVRWRM
ncbi:C21orf59_2 [Blepharisma stoltei]|uniref:Uncharacterized protein n=1 Tax=Blepharisma stoltei TaxID=1481888 RepID=A0AAU9JX54_9CILI|nr:unnamed protein product [Blepharisma stoltei]